MPARFAQRSRKRSQIVTSVDEVRYGRLPTNTVYPFAVMKVGDWFSVPFKTREDFDALRGSVVNRQSRFSEDYDLHEDPDPVRPDHLLVTRIA